MATFQQPVTLGPKDGSRLQRVIATVGTGNTYAVMPSPLLGMLGINPEWTAVLETADGGQEEYPLAEVRIKVGDSERTIVCVFGKPDNQPVLGQYTLDGFGLAGAASLPSSQQHRIVPVRSLAHPVIGTKIPL